MIDCRKPSLTYPDGRASFRLGHYMPVSQKVLYEFGPFRVDPAQFNYLPTLRALLALSHGDPSRAIESLQAASPYELGEPGSSAFATPLHPVYVRGEACSAAHHGVEAATEFQKILDHRGVTVNDPVSGLAYLQLGRAYAMQGDTMRAKAAYQDFLTLWKDADSDIPIYRQARTEYVKLH